MTPLHIALVGAGLIGRKHLQLLQEHPDCIPAALCDTDERAAPLAARAGIPFYRHVEELLARETLDGAIVATPTPHHAAVGVACAGRGLHLLIEKPLAATVAEGEQLIEAAERHAVHLLVGHHRRHNPLVQQARQIVRGGQIGSLVGVTAAFAILKPAGYFDVSWRTRPGGGPILINLIHDLDTLRFVAGEIAQVFAVTSSRTRGFEVEDTAALTLTFAGGAVGTVFASDATPAPWSYELTSGENPAYPHLAQDCYRFLGSTGSLAFPSMTLWRYADPQAAGWWEPLAQTPLPAESADPLTAQLSHFCRVIRGEERPLVDGREGLKTLALTLAVGESARQGQPLSPHL